MEDEAGVLALQMGEAGLVLLGIKSDCGGVWRTMTAGVIGRLSCPIDRLGGYGCVVLRVRAGRDGDGPTRVFVPEKILDDLGRW